MCPKKAAHLISDLFLYVLVVARDLLARPMAAAPTTLVIVH